jgi:hypothetical protein
VRGCRAIFRLARVDSRSFATCNKISRGGDIQYLLTWPVESTLQTMKSSIVAGIVEATRFVSNHDAKCQNSRNIDEPARQGDCEEESLLLSLPVRPDSTGFGSRRKTALPQTQIDHDPRPLDEVSVQMAYYVDG